MTPNSAPPLSVILATTDPPPWSDLVRALALLEPQVRALGGELIVGDGHGVAIEARGIPESPSLSWISLPGASVFELRAKAAQVARGEIIAVTEDHCIVAAGWCQTILEAFAAHPEAMTVSGPVLNGSREHLIDWANYLHTFGSVFPPCDPRRGRLCLPSANLAYRRSALPPIGVAIAPGLMELDLNPRFFREGRCHFHDEMTVTHVQSHGFWNTLRIHFHNGRSTTGLHPVRLSGRQLPWNVYRSVVSGLGGGQAHRAVVRASLPLVFLLSCCHALGETVGIFAGPGNSPARLR